MSKPSRFWDRIAKRYAKQPVADEAAYQRKLEVTRGYLRPEMEVLEVTRGYLRPEMEVLEFGCGTGTTALIHAPFVKHITSVDISRNMLDIARAKAEAGNVTNVSFEQANIDDLEAPDAGYDVIMGHSILHLLPDKEEVIAKVWRMLKPGGVFVSSTVCMKGRMPVVRAILPVGHFLGLLPMVKFFTADELERSLTEAGFQIDHRWRPEKSKAVFIVATKPGAAGAGAGDAEAPKMRAIA